AYRVYAVDWARSLALRALGGKKNPAEVRTQVEDLLKDVPVPEAALWRGKAREATRRYGEAYETYTAAVPEDRAKTRPEDGELLLSRAACLLEGKNDPATEKLRPSPQALARLDADRAVELLAQNPAVEPAVRDSALGVSGMTNYVASLDGERSPEDRASFKKHAAERLEQANTRLSPESRITYPWRVTSAVLLEEQLGQEKDVARWNALRAKA